MPIKFKDNKGKEHSFETHDKFVEWLRKNRPSIEDPNAYAAEIENRQKGSKKVKQDFQASGNMISSLVNKNVIKGTLIVDDSEIIVTEVEISLVGSDSIIEKIEPIKIKDNYEFEFSIEDRARNGEYSVAWVTVKNDKVNRVFDSFVIHGDEIDRTLPIELQYLK